MRQILAKMDDLEADFEKMSRIRDAVRRYRSQVETLDARLERLSLGGGGGRGRRR